MSVRTYTINSLGEMVYFDPENHRGRLAWVRIDDHAKALEERDAEIERLKALVESYRAERDSVMLVQERAREQARREAFDEALIMNVNMHPAAFQNWLRDTVGERDFSGAHTSATGAGDHE